MIMKKNIAANCFIIGALQFPLAVLAFPLTTVAEESVKAHFNADVLAEDNSDAEGVWLDKKNITPIPLFIPVSLLRPAHEHGPMPLFRPIPPLKPTPTTASVAVPSSGSFALMLAGLVGVFAMRATTAKNKLAADTAARAAAPVRSDIYYK
jgi:hypothetical protein